MEPSSSSSSLSSSIGDKEDIEHTMQGPKQSIEEKQNLALSEPSLSNQQCRICFAPEEASGADPILLLECACKGDFSYGHQSCLKKWFRQRFQRDQNLDCEVCRSPLGARLKEIIQSFSAAEVVLQHAPRLLLLLQVPPDDLDHLQVPLETPDFFQLPSETRSSLEASLEQLERELGHGQSRRREAFEAAQRIAADREPSEVVNEESDEDLSTTLRLEARLADAMANDIILHFEEPDDTEDPSEDPDQSEDEFIDCPEGRVLRVPIIIRPEDSVLPSHVEDLLDEISMQVVRFVEIYGEDLLLFPSFMGDLVPESDGQFSITPALNEFHDNDDIPIAIPVLNPSSDDPDPVFAEEARQTDLIPRRLYTYGRLQTFELL